MISKSGISWTTLQSFLETYMEKNISYRAGAIYEAFINENGGQSNMTRKDFEMFLRHQVMKDDGMLKRVAHGIYQIRTDPNDRGILFTEAYGKHRYGSIVNDPLYSPLSADGTEISLDDLLDDALDLTRKIEFVLNQINKNHLTYAEEHELKKLRNSLLKSMDTTVTGITAIMAWQENHLNENVQDIVMTMM